MCTPHGLLLAAGSRGPLLTYSAWCSQVAALPEDAHAPLKPGGDVDGAQWREVSQCRHMPGQHRLTLPGTFRKKGIYGALSWLCAAQT